MASVIVELQKDALDRKVPITDLLRKAFIVARKLKIAEFENWVSNELNGYENSEDIPEYRKIGGFVKAWNPYRGWQPVFFPNSGLQQALSIRPCNQTIAEIESLLGSESKSRTLQMPYSAKTEQQLRKSIDFDTQITLVIPCTALVRIVDAVRTIVLNWSIKLEEDGIIGESLTFTSQERETAERASYNINNFYGPVQSPQIQQQTSKSFQVSSVDQFDIDSVNNFLSNIGRQIENLDLSSDTKKELNSEINTAKAQTESPKPKHAIIRETLSSIRRILEGAGGGVATQLLTELGKLLL